MIKVLVVDDSAFMRHVISDILNSDKDIKVVATASDPESAYEKALECSPDVITMDLAMPGGGGISAIQKIMKECPVPIIIVSAYSPESSAQSLEAMEAGAVDFVMKPSGPVSADIEVVRLEINSKVKTASKAKIRKLAAARPKIEKFSKKKEKIIVIGSSTGGPQTLESLLKVLPKDIPVPILVAQHMPPAFTRSFAERLNTICDIEVKEAQDGEEVKPGQVYIAPGDSDMVLEKKGHLVHIKLIRDKQDHIRPTIDKLFTSVADIYKDKAVGIVLTGMGKDGTEGSRSIKAANGKVIAESKESSIIFGMPKSVIDSGLADEVVGLDKMAVTLVQLCEE